MIMMIIVDTSVIHFVYILVHVHVIQDDILIQGINIIGIKFTN